MLTSYTFNILYILKDSTISLESLLPFHFKYSISKNNFYIIIYFFLTNIFYMIIYISLTINTSHSDFIKFLKIENYSGSLLLKILLLVTLIIKLYIAILISLKPTTLVILQA